MAAASSCNFLVKVPFSRNNPSSSGSSGSRPSSSLFSRHPPSSFKNPHLSLHHHPHNPGSPFQFPLLSVSLARPTSPISSSAESTHHPTFVDPSLRHANVLFFKSAYNVQVVVDDNEPEEALLRRFRREVMRAGVIQECKRRRHFENKQEEKKRRVRDAAKRNKRRTDMLLGLTSEWMVVLGTEMLLGLMSQCIFFFRMEMLSGLMSEWMVVLGTEILLGLMSVWMVAFGTDILLGSVALWRVVFGMNMLLGSRPFIPILLGLIGWLSVSSDVSQFAFDSTMSVDIRSPATMQGRKEESVAMVYCQMIWSGALWLCMYG